MIDTTKLPPEGDRNIRDDLTELAGDDNLLFMDGFDDCIIGISSVHGEVPRVAYSVEAIIASLQKNSEMTFQEATEHYEFNIACCYAGPYTPALVLAAPGVEITTEDDE
jgi:hypothetical protein